ncbi:sensor histidine kinase [Bradyrhizobium prioriisuperbiae]|uniref:sensor histidine kinase n=1 Tax=Bradyrhizobium prioriisuperbiae TaxID=2854389 RepID=UPI0028E8CB26|nr:ATP-binding protein [Bradyrhizobium prioritasuperba]
MAIFALDTITDLEIAAAVFYVAVILLSVGFCQRRGILLIGGICVALTLVSYLITPSGSPRSGLINCVISLLAIAATTYLVVRMEAARIAAEEARAQLAHVARVTTLGELAASIAHEVNQPLAAVVTNGNAGLRWLANATPDLDKAKQAFERIVRDANRAGEIVGRVRALARHATPGNAPLSLNDLVVDTLALIRGEIQRHEVSLQLILQADIAPVSGDKVQLQQAVLNLIMNAIESMGSVVDGQRILTLRTADEGAAAVSLTIEDTGIGFQVEARDRLFDAFYTTKPQGMGMGLAISRTIIEAHRGAISAASRQPRGAIFRFTLPVRRVDTRAG